MENTNLGLQWLSSMFPESDESENLLEIWNDKIANIPVRFYKPKIHGSKRTTGVVYFHGGGFTLGSVGKL